MDHLLDVLEASKVLSISPWTVRAYVASGRLNPVRIGRRVLFEQAEIESFIEACKEEAGQQ